LQASHCSYAPGEGERYREANCYANGLARLGTKHDDDVLYYNSPPPSILNVFLLDLFGHESSRLCPATDVSVSLF